MSKLTEKKWHLLRPARAVLAPQIVSVLLRTERTWPSHTRKCRCGRVGRPRRLNALAERQSADSGGRC